MAPFKFTEAILAGKKLTVFNYGKHRRDFTYIDDIIEGVIRVLDSPSKINSSWDGVEPDPASSAAPWSIYNIGNNNPIELMDFIRSLEIVLGKKADLEFQAIQPGDVLDTWADVTELVEHFNYRPATSIEVGVENFVKWYRDYFKV